MTAEQIILRNRMACLNNCGPFQKIFKERLIGYWDGNVLGLNVLKIDRLVSPEVGESTYDAIERKYGRDGLQVVKNLLGDAR